MGKVYEALSRALKNEEKEPRQEQDKSSGIHGAIPPGDAAELSGRNFSEQVEPGDVLIESRSQMQNEKLLTLTDSFPEISESFRRLRTKILMPSSGRPPRSILVTSVAPHEGKSFICANLGVVLAHGIDQHALMVDCDLRRSTLAGMFNVSNEKGVADYLLRGDDLTKFIRKTPVRKLSIIPSGRPLVNPAELLASGKMEALVQEVVARYADRFILLDSPPLRAASETAVLAKVVDGVVLVIRWGGADRNHVKEFVSSVGKEKIIGVVFNGFEKSELATKLFGAGNYGYGHYHYSYNEKND